MSEVHLSEMQDAIVRAGAKLDLTKPEYGLTPGILNVVRLANRSEDIVYGHRHSEPVEGIDGFCGVYFRTDVKLWFAVRETRGGSSRSTGCNTVDEAVAHLYCWVAQSYSFWNKHVAAMEHGDKFTSPFEKPTSIIRTEWQHYTISREPAKSSTRDGLGFGGRLFEFKIKANHRFYKPDDVIKSHNVWSQGVIPLEYRNILVPNAEQLPSNEKWWQLEP